jgi:hypothetical protein
MTPSLKGGGEERERKRDREFKKERKESERV